MQEKPWTASRDILNKWRIIREMKASYEAREDYVEADVLAEKLDMPPEDVSDVFQQLKDQGLAEALPSTLADTYVTGAFLTSAGRQMVRELEDASSSKLKQACSAALLDWLSARSANDGHATKQLFLEDPRGSYYGLQFPSQIVGESAKALRELKLIKALGSWQDPLLRADITTMGQQLVDHFDGDVGAWQRESTRRGGDSITISHSQGVNVAHSSPGATQSNINHQSIRNEILNTTAQVEEFMPVLQSYLSDSQVTELGHALSELRDSADHLEGDPKRAQRSMGVVRDVLVNASGSAIAVGLVAGIENLMSALS